MRNLLATSAVATFLTLGGAAFAQDTTEEAVTEEAMELVGLTASSVVATVNGVELTLGHVITLRQQLPEEYRNLPDEVLYEGILNQLIEQSLLANQVDANNLPLEVKLSLENELRAQMAATQIDTIIGRNITEEALEAVYVVTVAEMEATPEYNASHILVETEEEALALIVELDAGKDFAELAMEKSTGPSGPRGGDLGWFGLGMMVPEFELAVTSIEVGAVSAPVQTQFGWHVVKLDDFRETPVPTLAEMRPQLMDQLRQEAVSLEIEAMTESADITRVEGVDPAQMRDLSLLSE